MSSATTREASPPRHRKSRKDRPPGRARHVVYGVLLGFLLVLSALAGLGAAIEAGAVSPGAQTPPGPSSTESAHGRHAKPMKLTPANTTPVPRHVEQPAPSWLMSERA